MKKMWLMGLVVMVSTVISHATILQLGYVNSATGLPTATATAYGYPLQIKTQSFNPTGTYVKAIGQTFMTPASTQNMVLTNFAVQLCGAAYANAPTDLGANYALQFKLFDSSGNVLMTKNGIYHSYGWNHHFECDANSESSGWLFTDTNTSSLPTLAPNTSYYWEVEVLSVSGPNSFNGTGLYVPCVNDSSALACDWLSTGGGYYRYSDGTQGKLLNWTSRAVDTNFTMLFTTVPEPVTLVMLGTGLLGILRRKV